MAARSPPRFTPKRYTIDELGSTAARALAKGYEPPENGQINPLPARRTIRYYTTLGILDRPAEMRGRTAYYGVRHLRQLVAIKRLQAEGLSLAQVQARLAGIPDGELEAVARVPAALIAESGADANLDCLDRSETMADSMAATMAATPRRERSAFWREVPGGESGSQDPVAHARAPGDGASVLVGVAIGAGVWLQLEPARALSGRDTEAIRAAARPILDALCLRGLIAARAAEKEETE
jgi:DNA-binding transcriptional MerR regulator